MQLNEGSSIFSYFLNFHSHRHITE